MKELDDITFMTVTRDGFVEAFWSLLKNYYSAGEKVSHRQVFDELNDRFESVFGEPRWPSFDAFLKYRDRNSHPQDRN